jgi:hypothetical protein
MHIPTCWLFLFVVILFVFCRRSYQFCNSSSVDASWCLLINSSGFSSTMSTKRSQCTYLATCTVCLTSLSMVWEPLNLSTHSLYKFRLHAFTVSGMIASVACLIQVMQSAMLDFQHSITSRFGSASIAPGVLWGGGGGWLNLRNLNSRMMRLHRISYNKLNTDN